MNLIELTFLIIPILLYVMFSLLFHRELSRQYKPENNETSTVSVIVAARNEADHILACLASLAQLDYPEEALEILIVNDRSEDATHQIITQFIADKPRFHYHQAEQINPSLSGKASAIAEAIAKSRGEIIFITDADCVVPRAWVRKMVSYFGDRIGLVAGFTLPAHARGLFQKLQTLDWAYLLSVAAGTTGMEIPLTCTGNNFAFRRCVYEEIGGYEGVGFSIAEDFALLKAVAARKNWKIIFPIASETFVQTHPVKNFHDFFNQRKRWAIGGNSVHWFGKLLIGVSLITHFTFLFLLFFYRHDVLALIFFAVLIASDYLMLQPTLTRLNHRSLLKYLLLYKIFYIFYAIVLLMKLLWSQKIVWKGIEYSPNGILPQQKPD